MLDPIAHGPKSKCLPAYNLHGIKRHKGHKITKISRICQKEEEICRKKRKKIVIEDITQTFTHTTHRTTEPVPALSPLQAPKDLNDAHVWLPDMEDDGAHILSENSQLMPLERKK